MNMSVGCHVLRDVVSHSGPPFPYLFNNGAAEIGVLEVPIPVSLNSTLTHQCPC